MKISQFKKEIYIYREREISLDNSKLSINCVEGSFNMGAFFQLKVPFNMGTFSDS